MVIINYEGDKKGKYERKLTLCFSHPCENKEVAIKYTRDRHKAYVHSDTHRQSFASPKDCLLCKYFNACICHRNYILLSLFTFIFVICLSIKCTSKTVYHINMFWWHIHQSMMAVQLQYDTTSSRAASKKIHPETYCRSTYSATKHKHHCVPVLKRKGTGKTIRIFT